MNTPRETNPVEVPARDKPAGEVREPQKPRAEPAVWTERMLAALEGGMKGKQWFSLIDKVYSERTLQLAWEKVRSNAGGSGVDGISVARYAKDCPRELLVLKEQLRQASYQPSPVKRVWIPKPGTTQKRPLGIPTVRDRVVQTALRMAIEPIFEHQFAEHSYGFRPGRGSKEALRRVQALINEGNTYVVDADIKSYFDMIPKDRLMSRVSERIADSRVLALIRSYLDQKVMEDFAERESGQTGTPQGAVISPLLANIYLNPLDHRLAGQNKAMVRYADDFVILCRSEAEARAALAEVETWMRENGLRLHPGKTRIVNLNEAGEGFDFLGYHFRKTHRWPRRKAMERVKARIKELTPRNSGKSLGSMIEKLNETMRGWYGYFKHSHRATFPGLDGYMRGRLRSMLRKREGKRGEARGTDNQKWSNHYFAAQGLFSLTQAHAAECQSPR